MNEHLLIVESWWKNQDFNFITSTGERYCCKNAYPTTLYIEGGSSEESILTGKRYYN